MRQVYPAPNEAGIDASSTSGFIKASDKIVESVIKAIADGSLAPGAQILEAELCERYGVSRTPVREALIRLEAQGWISSKPRGGLVVEKMDLQQVMALWELLAELEALAVRLACERMLPEEIEKLRQHHEQSAHAAESGDELAWQENNLQFHEMIYAGTRNQYIRQEVLNFRARIGHYRRHAFGAIGKIATSFEQHKEIVDAIMARDCAKAAAAMLNHMRPALDSKAAMDLIMNFPK